MVESWLMNAKLFVTYRKSKWEWVQLVSCVTLRIQSRMGHGNSQELELSSVMIRYLLIFFFLCCFESGKFAVGFVVCGSHIGV